MTMYTKTADLMVTDMVILTPEDNLASAREVMKQYSIRHVPVVDPVNGNFLGLISQRTILKEAFNIANKFGIQELEYQEKKRKIVDFMAPVDNTITSDTPLLDAGEHFIKIKHGCLPVVDGNRLVGIITSSDFVKLSVALLRERA